jgi:TolA-binding protein
MHDEKQYWDLIERYHEGRLEKDELENFEKRLKEDDQLLLDIQYEKNFRELENKEDILAFRENVAKEFMALKTDTQITNASLSAHENATIGRRKIWLLSNNYRITASMTILFGLSILIYFLLQNKASTEERLFAQYFQSYPGDMISRSDTDTSSLMKSAFDYYSSNNFRKASELFSKNLLLHPEDDLTRFFYAQTCIEDEQYNKAVELLSYFERDSTHAFYEQSRWYIALISLKTSNEKEKVIRNFKEIIVRKGYNYRSAMEIVRKLE